MIIVFLDFFFGGVNGWNSVDAARAGASSFKLSARALAAGDEAGAIGVTGDTSGVIGATGVSTVGTSDSVILGVDVTGIEVEGVGGTNDGAGVASVPGSSLLSASRASIA
jgi:hypothetical protein